MDLELGLEAVEELRALLPADVPLARLALRWILEFPEISTVIPGARTPEQARANALASDLPRLTRAQLEAIAELYADRIAPFVHARW